MKRIFRVSLGLSIIATVLTPISAQAVSANPSAVCSGATCTVTFTYTGDYYLWSAPLTGSFTLEVWGAKGGGTGSSYWGNGGNGGYSKGNISLTSGQNLYVYPGQQGFQSATTNSFNGGGKGNPNSSYGNGWTGGGATHIATALGALSSLSGNQSAVKIVAGGGGGAAGSQGEPGYNIFVTNGGAGGGSSGIAGANSYNDSSYRAGGAGGTQVAGGISSGAAVSASFGRGADASTNTADAIQGGGGGGGWYGGGAGMHAGGGGGGGSGYVGGVTSTTITAGNATMPNPIGGTMTGNSGNGVARITYPNGPSVSNFSPILKITNSSSISFDLVFSETVTGLIPGDFSLSGTGSSTCTIGAPSGSGASYTVALTNCSVGTVILTIGANTVTNSGSQTGPSSNTVAETVVIDQTAPTVSTVSAPANSTYSNNQTPTFTMVFSESVTVTGTPRLTLTVGSVTKYANYLSMSDSKTALFRYTVTTDPLEFDTDGIAVSTTLDLNSGSILDLATNTISNLSFAAPTLTSVFVAQLPVAPTIDSVVATSGTLTIYFTPGAARGSTTSSYQYTTDNNTFKNLSPVSTGSPMVVTTISNGATNLVNGTGYQIRIRAVTNAGNSSISNLVIETPTAVSVSGDATLTLTYGNSASTSSYAATGGTSTYTWSLGSVISGITLSGTTVTAANTLAAGSYSQTVRATDTNSQVGTRQLTITVNRASTSISIALPNSATSAALGGTITITATVSRAGSVNFQLGGTTLSGCGSAAAATTSATCSWTPASLGSVSLTAIFTPTDSSNFETSTTTTLSITVVNGVSTVTLSLNGGVTQVPKGQSINIIAAVDQAGKISFFIDGKRLPGCTNKSATVGNVTCSWRPAVQKAVVITANLNPTNSVYNNSTSRLAVQVTRRTGAR